MRLVILSTVPAKPSEFADLKKELEQRGYKLNIRKKRSPKMGANYYNEFQRIYKN